MNEIVRINSHAASLASALAVAVAVPVAGTASAAPPESNGATVFRQRCQSCHSMAPDKASPLGPHLAGVVGRKAGSTSFNYSPAMKRSGLTWDGEHLDRYLAAPVRTMPGTRMTVALSDPKQRAALIAYLGKFK